MEKTRMNNTRRTLLKAGTNGAVLASLFAAGILRPVRVLAADPRRAAFEATGLADALRGLSAETPAESADLVLKAPDIAENGAVVPVEVISNIPGTTSLSILVDNNPLPLALHVEFSGGAVTETVARLKMAKTSAVRAVAQAGGKFYVARREIKVTIGGCGG